MSRESFKTPEDKKGADMGELNSLLERVKIHEIIAYLMYGTESEEEECRDTYDEKIQNAFDQLFDALEHISSDISRKDDEVYGAVLDFSIAHTRVYMEMGLIAGFQLYKTLEEKGMSKELRGLKQVIERSCHEKNIV